MADDVKGSGMDVNRSERRSYDSSGRRERARTTRRQVLAAASRLFQERGYATTTIADVAASAGVSEIGVRKGFGTKAALLKEVFDVAIAGDDEPVAVRDRPAARDIRNEPDLREKLRLYAAQAAAGGERSAGIQLVIRNGASSDPALRELWDTLLEQRLVGMTMFAAHLAATGGLRVDADEARDVLWTCISVEVYDLLVNQRGWSLPRYADWLDRTLAASLLPENDQRRDRDDR